MSTSRLEVEPSLAKAVRYRSSRADIWRAYWFPPERRLLRGVMTLISALLAVEALVIATDARLHLLSRILGASLFFCLAVVGSPAYALLGFKSDERTLETGRDGLSTTIGRRSGKVAWSQVARIAADSSRLYFLAKNGNSFVVPFEAFADDGERNEFTELAARWVHDARAA